MIQANTTQFRDALHIAARACPNKATAPVLSHVLLCGSATQKRIEITGTTLDVRIKTSCPAECDEDFSICVSGRLLSQVMGSIAGAAVQFKPLKTRLEIASGSSRFKLHGLSPEEFPPAPGVEGGATISMTQSTLAKYFASVSAAQSDDETRYILCGTYARAQDRTFNFAATDGRRLHLTTAGSAEDLAKMSLILPAQSAAVLVPLLDEGEKVELTLAARTLHAMIDRAQGVIEFHSKVFEGSYPNYAQVIPKSDLFVDVPREPMLAAVRLVALCCSEKSRSVKIKLDGSTLTFSAQSPDFGEASEVVELKEASTAKGEIAINPQFITDALEGTEEETIKLGFTIGSFSTSPMHVKADGYQAVVMPVRLS